MDQITGLLQTVLPIAGDPQHSQTLLLHLAQHYHELAQPPGQIVVPGHLLVVLFPHLGNLLLGLLVAVVKLPHGLFEDGVLLLELVLELPEGLGGGAAGGRHLDEAGLEALGLGPGLLLGLGLFGHLGIQSLDLIGEGGGPIRGILLDGGDDGILLGVGRGLGQRQGSAAPLIGMIDRVGVGPEQTLDDGLGGILGAGPMEREESVRIGRLGRTMVGNQQTIDDLGRRGLATCQMDGQASLIVGGLGRFGILEKEGKDDGLGGLFAAGQVDGQIAAAVLLGSGIAVGGKEGFDDYSVHKRGRRSNENVCEMIGICQIKESGSDICVAYKTCMSWHMS